MSYEGQHHPKLITATVGLPAAAGGLPVSIPNLPQGLKFPLTVPGKATDGFFTKARTTDFASLATGADGNTVLIANADKSGMFTIVLQRGSLGCRILGLLYAAQELIGEGQLPAFTFPVSFADFNCTPPERHQGFDCLIQRPPDVTYGAGLDQLSWAFVSATVVSDYSSRAT